MNGFERCSRAIAWREVDRPPVVLQDCGLAVQSAGHTIREACMDGLLMAKDMEAFYRELGTDGLILGPDAALLAEAVGCPVEYNGPNPPAIVGPVINDLSEVSRLSMPDLKKNHRVRQWLTGSEYLLDRLGKEAFIVCRADQGAFSLAAQLRGMERFSMDLLDEDKTEQVHALLRFALRLHLAFAKEVAAIGAHMTTCGDAYGGPALIGPQRFKEFVLPYEIEAAATIQGEYGIPYAIHICGRTDEVHDVWSEVGSACIEVDHKTNFQSLREKTYGKTALLGNIDTGLLCLGSTGEVGAACENLLKEAGVGAKGVILSSGCMLGSNTKLENLRAIVDFSKKIAG